MQPAIGRQQFLEGATAWSSQGAWNAIADADPLLSYSGNWQSVSSAGSTDGIHRKASVTKKSAPRLELAFQGTAMQLLYPRNSKGGLADVYVDGVLRGRISYFDASASPGKFALNNLPAGLHRVQLRGIQGDVYFDGGLLDGGLFATNTQLVEESETFTGTMGPSVENLEIDEFQIEVDSDVTTLKAVVGWDGGVDIDFSLVDPNGVEVASGATLANPETLEFAVTQPGTYTYRVKGYATVLANYTLTSTKTRAVVTTP